MKHTIDNIGLMDYSAGTEGIDEQTAEKVRLAALDALLDNQEVSEQAAIELVTEHCHNPTDDDFDLQSAYNQTIADIAVVQAVRNLLDCCPQHMTVNVTARGTGINLSDLSVGDKVHWQPEHYAVDLWDNGIVKEIPDFAFNEASPVGYNCVRVVYHCGGDWDNYQNYRSVLTNLRGLKYGWK